MGSRARAGDRFVNTGRTVPLPPAPLDRSYTDRDLGEQVRREIDRIERLKKRIAR